MLRQLGPQRSPASFQIRKKGKDSNKPSRWPIRTPLRPTEQSPHRSRVADLPSSGSLISASIEGSPRDPRPRKRISASLEDSRPALERVANLRLAQGQRTCPRAGGQSPPRSRTADLPSSGWPISASLEDSGPALERVANLRLARGQRTCPRAGGQSPPRSRTADLPSSGWPI